MLRSLFKATAGGKSARSVQQRDDMVARVLGPDAPPAYRDFTAQTQHHVPFLTRLFDWGLLTTADLQRVAQWEARAGGSDMRKPDGGPLLDRVLQGLAARAAVPEPPAPAAVVRDAARWLCV